MCGPCPGQRAGEGDQRQAGIRLEALAVAGGAGLVGAITGEQDPDVHFVGLRLQPAKVAFDAIPGLGPGVLLAVIGIAVDDPALLGGRQIAKRHVHGNAGTPSRPGHIGLAFAAGLGLPRFDGALREGFGVVGNGQLVIDGDDASEPLAVGAGAEGMVETEERGAGRLVFEVASGAVKVAREAASDDPVLRRGGSGAGIRGGGAGVNFEFAVPEVVRLFTGLDEPRPLVWGDLEAILNDGEALRRSGISVFEPAALDPRHLAVDEDSLGTPGVSPGSIVPAKKVWRRAKVET